MSIQAISWVLSQEIFPSSAKFVLLGFADCAGHEGIAYPSVKHLCRVTSLNRKTVLQCVHWLMNNGFLIDTQKRTGATGQVRVFKLNGLPSDTNHYVYKLINELSGEFYIGVRSCYREPSGDKYFGSGNWAKKMQKQKVVLKKEIIATFEDRDSANAHETRTILNHISDPLCRNETPTRRVPKTVPFGQQAKSPNYSRKESQNFHRRVPKTGYGTNLKEPLLNHAEKQQTANIEQIADHIAKMKAVTKARS